MNKLFFILSFMIVIACNNAPEPVTNAAETKQAHQKIKKAPKDTSDVVENSTKNVPRLSDSTIDASIVADSQDKKNVSNSKLPPANSSSKPKLSATSKSTTNTTPSKAKAVFEQKIYNFGTIKQGEKVKTNFKFKNTGKSALVVKSAEATCGCTEPGFPFMPIEPGEDGYISVSFDSKGKEDHQKPMVTIHTNADPAVYVLFMEGIVEVPPKEEKKDSEEKIEDVPGDEEVANKEPKKKKKDILKDSLELIQNDSI